MINGKWRRSLQDVRVRRGADVSSDHHLVTAMVKLKLQRICQTVKCQRRFDVANLKNSVQRQLFSVELCNRFDALAMANDDANNHGREQQWAEASVDDCWANIVRIYYNACTTTLGFKQKTNKEWLSDNTWNAINERQKVKCKLVEAKSPRIKERLQAQYSILNVQVRSSARADKRQFIENLATEAEEGAGYSV